MGLYGVGRVMCSQLIAEIGDVRRFEHSKSIVAMAGIDGGLIRFSVELENIEDIRRGFAGVDM